MRNIIYLSKDILRKDYIQPYNSKVETPNIQRHADEGTVFNNYYCSSPSSGMAASCLFSGLSAYQLDRKTFKEVDKFEQTSTVFSEFEDRGVKTHVLWTKEFRHLAFEHSKIFDDRTDLIWLDSASSVVSPQKHAFDKIKSKSKNDNNHNPRAASLSPRSYTPTPAQLSMENGAEAYFKKIEEISQTTSPWFLWCHLPHVFYPFKAYGSDIHLFDWLVGQIRDKIDADLIISADHGHLKGEKGVIVYGFELYESVVHIPLITPDFFGKKSIDFPVEQNQLKEILLNKKLDKKDYIYSDTQYYGQPNRKLMILKNNYKYIYNKKTDSEELFDLDFDPSENINLLISKWPDFNRGRLYDLKEVIHYDNWEIAKKYFFELRNEKNRIWRKGGFFEEKYQSFKARFSGNSVFWKKAPDSKLSYKEKINILFNSPIKKTDIILKGRWNSKARFPIL